MIDPYMRPPMKRKCPRFIGIPEWVTAYTTHNEPVKTQITTMHRCWLSTGHDGSHQCHVMACRFAWDDDNTLGIKT